MTDFKGGGIPTPDYDSDDVNYVSEKTEFTNDVFVYGKLYADLGGDVQTFSTAGVERIRITKDGQVIKPDPNDTIYAMKDGGPLGEALNKTPIMLKSLIDLELDSLDLMRQQNKILIAILNKNDIMPTPIGNNNTIDNFDQSGDIFRELQMS